MTRSIALGMLRQGNTGDEILQILDVIVEDITQENINDCAEYFASISRWFVVLWVILRGDTFSPFFSNNYLQKVLKNVYKWLNKYTLPFYLVENSSLDTTQKYLIKCVESLWSWHPFYHLSEKMSTTPLIKFPKQNFVILSVMLINMRGVVDNNSQTVYTL